MSDYGFSLERARSAAGLVSQLESRLTERPNDVALRLTLASATKMAERAERELYEVAAVEQVDICRYRLVRHALGGYGIASLSRSLEMFQEAVSYVYAAVGKGGAAKSKSRLGRDDRVESELLFGYSYAGSLGVVLLAPSERGLFFTRFDDVVRTIGEVFDIHESHELRDAARKIGTPAIRRLYGWAEANAKAGFDLDLRWTNSNRIETGRYLEAKEFGRLAELISLASDVEQTVIKTRGTLVGFDSVYATFHLVEPDGESYKGHLEDGFPTYRDWTVNKRYSAVIRSEVTTRFSTDERVSKFSLTSLKPEDD